MDAGSGSLIRRGPIGSTGLIGRLAAVVIAAVVLALTLAPAASADRNFTQRQQIAGSVDLAQVTNGWTRANGTNIDIDSDPATTLSSSADLTLPAGATVRWAGLYWGLNYAGGTTDDQKSTVQFRAPGDDGYTALGPAGVVQDQGATDNQASSFIDVTSQVAAAGAGTYTVADTDTATRGGWGMLVIYEAPGLPPRGVSVYDGLRNIFASSFTTTITGILTPPSGPVNTNVGLLAYQADPGYAGDSITLNNVALGDTCSPTNDLFNGSHCLLGANITDRNPNQSPNVGHDGDLFSANNILPNGATSATVTIAASGDRVYPHALSFVTDLYAPDVTATKQIANITEPGEPADPTDELEYTITYANAPDLPNDPVDTADNFVITDPIPPNMTYVPGSLAIDGVAQGDAGNDGDEAEFDATNAVFWVGSGADEDLGGALAPGENVTVSFRVQVDAGSPGHLSTNTATGNFRAVTLNQPVAESASASIPVVPVHDLALEKTAPATVQPGQSLDYTLEVTNNGPSTSNPTTITDTLPDSVSYDDAASDGSCDQTGNNPTVITCNLGSVAGGTGAGPITIATTVDPNAAGSIENDAEVAGDPSVAEANSQNNDDSVLTQVVRSSDLGLTKTAPPGPYQPGSLITYTLTARNDGPHDSPATVVRDTLPTGLTHVSDTGNCDTSGLPEISCDIGPLANGAEAAVEITARLPATPGAAVINSASVGGTNEDPNPDDDASAIRIEIASEPAAASSDSRCFFGNEVTILGTNESETLTGTPGRDVINGRRGDDVIVGLEGDDLICGGRGEDLIKGGPGDDRVKGSVGDDVIRGNLGDDWLRGAPGDDRISGRAGDDRLMGNAGDDRLRGRQGEDFLLGGPGRDWGHGGPGDDRGRSLVTAFSVGRD